MNRENVLVVVVDGLRASAIGAYGNTTYATPALDEFAADSFLLDFCFAPATELSQIYRALWHSVHPLRPMGAEEDAPSLPRLFSQADYAATLITDEAELRDFATARQFGQLVNVAPLSDQPTTENTSQTTLARLFAVARENIESQPRSAVAASDTHRADVPRLIWVHSRGMYGAWDAPIDFQQALLDEGDPPPVESVVPADLVLSDADDPDVAFRYSCAYAAQVMVFDACWRELMETLAARERERWLVVLLGARGFPLGEHRRIGGVDPRLYSEQLHVPFLIRFPEHQGQFTRSGALVSIADLLPTLASHVGNEELLAQSLGDGSSIVPLISNASANWRDALLSKSASSRSLRTANWCWRHDDPSVQTREQTGSGLQSEELYVRPDDRWEANDVAKLCPDEVDTLARAADSISRQLVENQPLAKKLLSENGDRR